MLIARDNDGAGVLTEPPVAIDHDVFVVHADDDTPFVKGELLPLLGLPPGRVILSSELPPPGFVETTIAASVQRSRLTIAVVSPAYLRDRWAAFAELLSRNARDRSDGGTLVPLVIAACELPPILAQHARIDAETAPQREAAAARLRSILGRPAPAPERIPCPYPGMRPFSAATAGQFYGRTKEIEELVGMLHAGQREIYVIGPSGSGKSSLVAAGLIPQLDRYAVRSLRPGEHPEQRLAEALGCEAARLDGAIDRVLAHDAAERLVVFIDQLEELFTLAAAPERIAMVAALRVLRADRRCHVIVGLRADFYGALMLSELWPDIEGRFTRLEVGPLRGPALREAIEAPAHGAGVYLESALVERLIADTAAEPGALPLLQEALVLLWSKRSQRLLRLASYEALGSDGRSGLAVALARRADAVLHDLTSEQQLIARRIFLRLISFGEGRPDTRRQLPRAELASAGDDRAVVDAVIDRLIDERMLTATASASGVPHVDLSHEALIGGWPELQRWLRLRRDDEQHRRRLEQRAAEWVRRGSGSVGLLDAVELAEAERWVAGEAARELRPSDELVRYLKITRAALAETEQLRERERRATQYQRGLTKLELARSLLVEQQDAIAALPHLIDAIELGVDNPVLRTLLAYARRSVWLVTFHAGGPLLRIELSPDGAKVLTIGERITRLWNVASGAPVGASMEHGAVVCAAAFSPDGTQLLTVDKQGAVYRWDVATAALLARPTGAVGDIGAAAPPWMTAAFSPDRSRIVKTSRDGVAQVWDVSADPRLIHSLLHGNAVSSVAFSPDGTRVATTGDRAVRLWGAATGAPISASMSHRTTPHGAAFSPDGARIVTVTDDGAHVWSADIGAALFELDHHGCAFAVFSPDGERIVTADDDGGARLWDAVTERALETLQHDRRVWCVAFNPDGSRIATAGDDQSGYCWDSRSGVQIGPPLRHAATILAAAFSPDGTRLVTASFDGLVRVWDASTGMFGSQPLGHDRNVNRLVFSPDGARIVTATVDDATTVWDARSATIERPPVGHAGAVLATAFGAAGARVVVGDDHIASICDATGATLASLEHAADVERAVLSRDAARVLTVSADGAVRLWRTDTGTPLGPPFTTAPLAVDPDGAHVVSTDGRLWDASSGTPMGVPLEGGRDLEGVVFDVAGSRIVTASGDGTVRVWETATGEAVGLPLAHDQRVTGMKLSLDGSRLCTRDETGRARIWDAGANDLRPVAIGVQVASAALSPDGAILVTVDRDRTLRLWSTDAGGAIGPRFGAGVGSVQFSPDGARVAQIVEGSSPRLWDVLDTGSLAVWIKQARTCLTPIPVAVGQRVVCALALRDPTAEECCIRARNLIAIGDRATLSRVAGLARSAYDRAREALAGNPDLEVRGLLATRLAILDALDGRLAEARLRLGAGAPETDGELLDMLSRQAYVGVGNAELALALARRARELGPAPDEALAELAEVYLATGRYDDAIRTIAEIDHDGAPREARVVVSALAWAAARLGKDMTDVGVAALARDHAALTDGTTLAWDWSATRRALRRGRHRYADVQLVEHVLLLLEQPTDAEIRRALRASLFGEP